MSEETKPKKCICNYCGKEDKQGIYFMVYDTEFFGLKRMCNMCAKQM